MEKKWTGDSLARRASKRHFREETFGKTEGITGIRNQG
jgi:hypothetical protein